MSESTGVPMTEDERERLRSVEQQVGDIRVRQALIEAKVDANTEVTNSVKRDTSEIVELVKGSKVVGRVAKWMGAVGGGYLAGKGLKWW